MRRKYLLLPLVALPLILAGCGIITQPKPYAPSDLTGHTVSSSEINLTWKDNSPDETGFYIYRKNRKITHNYSRVGVVLANADSYSDKGLDPETTYIYKVTAYNDGGESESSNVITITTTRFVPNPHITIRSHSWIKEQRGNKWWAEITGEAVNDGNVILYHAEFWAKFYDASHTLITKKRTIYYDWEVGQIVHFLFTYWYDIEPDHYELFIGDLYY